MPEGFRNVQAAGIFLAGAPIAGTVDLLAGIVGHVAAEHFLAATVHRLDCEDDHHRLWIPNQLYDRAAASADGA